MTRNAAQRQPEPPSLRSREPVSDEDLALTDPAYFFDSEYPRGQRRTRWWMSEDDVFADTAWPQDVEMVDEGYWYTPDRSGQDGIFLPESDGPVPW